MTRAELKQRALDDLKRSGLDSKDFTKMKLMTCDIIEASAVLNSDFCAEGYVLPYFDPNGKLTDNIRFRFLEELLDKNGKVVKYSQPKGTAPQLYFSPGHNWKKILKDTSIPLVFTEGEKKAYKACKEGIMTIGLGGVWSFRSKKLNKALIDDFKYIDMKDRTILLCFDNDFKSNEDVMKALRAFAVELANNGATVVNKILPFNPYEKIGLDDYLLNHNKKDFDNLPEEVFENVEAMNELDGEVAYIKETGKFFIFDSDLFVSAQTLKDSVFRNRNFFEEGKPVSIAEKWLMNPNRRTHQRLTYKPGQPRVTADNELNRWQGWGCEPKKGSIKTFMDALKKIFGGDETLIQWFLDWVAYPIQNPGAKMLSAVLFQSVLQGTGKSSIGLCIGAMYGKNFNIITDKQLHAPFNEWAIDRQFILGDEVSGKDKRSDSDFIKNLVTQETIEINKKYNPTYRIPDCMNYFLTSNHVDAWHLEPDDRRAFVWDLARDNSITLQEGIRLENFRKGEGKQHLLHYFIYEHKISKGFDHRARPPMTDAKVEMIDHSLTDIERWLTFLKDNPQHVLAIDGAPIDRDLFTTSQIIHLFSRQDGSRYIPTSTAMGKAIKKIFHGQKTFNVSTKTGSKRLHALRNYEKWKKATHQSLSDHYDKSKIALFEAKKKKHKAGEA